ncbi:hypothetical protein DPMN_114101 [Dreissena polymorpha]|uniref:Uncharacterized protein n=1 Tax=Dreissena polymorpha TaxID=45954 RepID=A0A9D4KJE7_DREPO|nr:hypothetical protein DPMN_114101 [Dreissena polymorpha]
MQRSGRKLTFRPTLPPTMERKTLLVICVKRGTGTAVVYQSTDLQSTGPSHLLHDDDKTKNYF